MCQSLRSDSLKQLGTIFIGCGLIELGKKPFQVAVVSPQYVDCVHNTPSNAAARRFPFCVS
jgi:hypothetical protein